MATGTDLVMQKLAEMAVKNLPPAVMEKISLMAQTVASFDARLARIEMGVGLLLDAAGISLPENKETTDGRLAQGPPHDIPGPGTADIASGSVGHDGPADFNAGKIVKLRAQE